MTNWQTKVLGELLTIRHGRNQREVESTDGEYPILGTGGEIGRANKFLYNSPSVLIGRKGTIDKPRYMDTPFWTVDTLFYSEIKPENDPKFLYYIFNTIDWKRYNEASGVPSLSASTISTIKVNVPEKPEQERIVGVLEVWDEYIEKLEQKIALKEQLKKGLMQQLLTGKCRMPGFSGEWDSISLGDLVSITTGRKDVNQGNPTGAYPFFTCSRNHTYSDEYSFDTEAILIAGNGDVGHCKYYMGKFEAYQRTYVLTNFNKVSAQYIFPFLRHYFQHFIESQKQMGAMPFIKVGMLRDFKIALPKNRAEQDVISKIIKSADDEIDLLDKKLRETRLQKKYLLKNLITGTILTPETLKPNGASS